MRCAICLLLVASFACGDDPEPSGVTPPAGDTALCVALGADYRNNVGLVSAVSLPSRTVFRDVVPGAASGDPVLRSFGGKLYIINRFGQSNVTVVDISQPLWRIEKQFSTGAGSNPNDVAVVGTKAYVVSFDSPELQVWDLGGAASPTAPLKIIDLSGYDSDANPDANSIYAVGDRAFVTLDLLDRQGDVYAPRGKGQVLVVDLASETVTGSFELNYENPYGFLVARDHDLLVPTLADFSGATGCLERIDTVTLQAAPCVVENADLGMATISSVAVTPRGLYLATSAYDADFNQTSSVRHLSVEGALAPASLTPAGQLPTDLAFSAPTDQLVYADGMGGGLRILDLATGTEVTSAPVDIGLPPATQNGLLCLPLQPSI